MNDTPVTNRFITAPGGNVVGAVIGGREARASGGPVKAGHVYTVGESGKETFVPTVNGQILPAGKTGGGENTVVAFYGNVYGFDDFERRVTEAIVRANRRGRRIS